jgi:hypothetical protein
MEVDAAALRAFISIGAGGPDAQASWVDEKLLDKRAGLDAADDLGLERGRVAPLVPGDGIEIVP